MELESFVLGKFPFLNDENDNISLHVISSKKYILKITADKQIFFFNFDENVNTFQMIWHSEATFSDCVLVSNDGSIFIKSTKNDFYMYRVKNDALEKDSELLFSQFKELLDPDEFSGCDLTINPVICVQKAVTLCLNNQWLATVEWLTSKEPTIVSCSKLDSVISSYVTNKEFIFSLTTEGTFFIHKIAGGTFLQKIDIWSWLPWKESYRLVVASEEPELYIALLDKKNSVYIFDLSAALSFGDNFKFDDSQSICSVSSGVSFKTNSSYSSASKSVSVAGSIVSKHTSLKYTAADDLWLSYIKKLKKKQSHEGSLEKRLSNSGVLLEDLTDDENIRKINFTDMGISVWTMSASASCDGKYRLYNAGNGQQTFCLSIPRHCHVLSLNAPTVVLDLFILNDSLCLPLCSISKHAFINKILQCIDSKWITMLLEGWDDILNVSNLVRSAVHEGQLDTVHLALNLHSHLFRSEIVGEGIDGARTKDILTILKEIVQNFAATEQFVRQIRGLQLTHSYRLLRILDEVNIPAFMQSEVAIIRNQIMESIVAARAGLESTAEGSAPVPAEHSVEWVLWDGMSDMDVVRVGVTQLSAVQCFLAVKRGWTPEDLHGEKFKQVVLSSAVHLLEKRDIEGASYLISHTGFNIKDELRNICQNSVDKSLVDFVIEAQEDSWTENELEAWHFLSLVMEVIDRHKRTLTDQDSCEDINISLNSIISLTADERQEIITELFFRTWDDTLIEKLTPDECWKYLIEINCIEGIEVWLGMQERPYLHPWPSELFFQWSITQEMIDSINNLACADGTKQSIFNFLSLKGLFCSDSIKNPRKIIRRLAETKSLADIENIIGSKFSKNFLSFVCDNNLIDLTVSLHQEMPSILSLDSYKGQRHRVKWLDLWQSFINLEDSWSDDKIVDVIQRTINLLSTSSQDEYLNDHPLVLIALALIQGKSLMNISNDPLKVSPLLAIGLPGSKSDERKETTLYSLLSGTTAFDTDNLFLFQKGNSKISEDEKDHLFPHFNCEKLSIQYGHKQCLSYVDYLKQARPSFAFVQFFNKFSDPQGNIPIRMQKHGKNVAHGLALQLFKDKDVGASCVAFIEMLSRDSTPLKIHLACIDAICSPQLERGTSEMRNILQGIVTNKQECSEYLLKLLEESLQPQLIASCGHNDVACLKLWQLPVMFANLHQLSLPESFLLFTAKNDNWLLFTTIVSLFDYPKWQVMQLIKNFKSESIQEHLMYAFQLKVDIKGNIINSAATPKIIKNLRGPEKFFPCVAEHENSPELLLLQARAHQCPGFALLATCFQDRNLVACFSEWLVASLPKGNYSFVPSNPMSWTSENVCSLLEEVVGLSYIHTLHRACLIFLPTNPLFLFSKFLKNTIKEKVFTDDVLETQEFSATLSSLIDDDQNFILSKKWVSEVIVQLCSVALIKCFSSYFLQYQFLRTICNTKLHSFLPVRSPDFQLLLSLSECLEKYGLPLDLAEICLDNGNFNLEKQLEKFIKAHKFDVAHCFATTAGLPHDSILLYEWKEKAKSRSSSFDNKFWEICDTAFITSGLSPDDAISFYSDEVDTSQSINERYIILKYLLKWIKSKPLDNITKQQELSVLNSIYQCYLQEDFNEELVVEGLNFSPLKKFRKHVVSQDVIDWFTENFSKSLTQIEIEKLDIVIGKLLSVGDVETVWCLEALFQFKNKDMLILDGCLGLAESEFTVDNLPENIMELLSDGSSSSRICSPDSFSSSNSRMSHSLLSSYSLLEDLNEVDLGENFDREDILRVVNLLVEKASSSFRLVQYIQSSLKIGKKFNLNYKEVIEIQNPLVLIEKGCDDLQVAKDIIVLANLPSDKTIVYLCSQIVKSISQCEKWLNSSEELTDISSLADDPLELGKSLLKIAVSLNQNNSSKQTVELLILAHNCFTRACNMEGISEVLKICQKLINVLLQNCQWSLMVRLLTGIGRYNEMRYIFHILKDNQQFEYLLSKGLDKYTGLKAATLEFVRGDKELFTLVALHFRMYSELAILFVENAIMHLDSLESVIEGKIIHSNFNVQALQAAIKAYSHAAQHCIQAKKLKKATSLVNQAELVGLQLTYLNDVEVGQMSECLLCLQTTQISHLIANVLNYEEACIVSRAYDVSVDWSPALYHQFIVKSKQNYINAWSRHHELTNAIVQDIARRFQQEKTIPDIMMRNMKQFVQMIIQSDIKYRVCSQLGFKDVLQTMLSGPDLPYLKDTVWQSGFKRQHM